MNNFCRSLSMASLATLFVLGDCCLAQQESGTDADAPRVLINESIAQTDWAAVDRALISGGAPLSRERREQAIEYCTREVTTSDRTLILECVFRATQRSRTHGYASSSPQSIDHLRDIVGNKNFDDTSRFTALCILALSLDDSDNGAKLEEQLWGEFQTTWTPEMRAAYVSSLAYAPWEDHKSRSEQLKDLFRSEQTSQEMRYRIVSAIGYSVAERDCPLLTGIELYGFFLSSDNLDRQNRQRIGELMEAWADMFQTQLELERLRERQQINYRPSLHHPN